MPRAIWNGAVIADSDETVVVDGNHYYRPVDVNEDYLLPSDSQTFCGWKGTASYYDIVVDGETNPDAAWFYPDTKEAANNIESRVAFWKGVEVR